MDIFCNRHIKRRFLTPILVIFLFACGETKNLTTALPAAPTDSMPDYSNLYFWAAHPYKKNASDSTPEPYRDETRDSTVDVFFIYPTNYLSDTAVTEANLADPAERKHWNAAINNAVLNDNVDRTSILFQASAFNRYRVFSPRYRQAHIKAFYIADSLSKPFFDTAYADVKHAFQYYLQHFNQGRPFIIASHSQGTLHAGRLIKDTIEQTALADKMIAAYIIGLPVPENYFTSCLPCSTAAQTNCFVSWRTFKKGYVSPYVAKEKYRALVVNPLTWTIDTTFASKKLNKGAVLFNFNSPKPRAVSAQIHGNVLWASKPHFFGSILYTKKNYHVGDINLFWKNIRDNAAERVSAYKQTHAVN